MSKERSGFLPMAIGLVIMFSAFSVWEYNMFRHNNLSTYTIDNSIDSAAPAASSTQATSTN